MENVNLKGIQNDKNCCLGDSTNANRLPYTSRFCRTSSAISTRKSQRNPKLREMSPEIPFHRRVKRKRGSSAHSTFPKKQKTIPNRSRLEEAKIVVGVDFGTTLSGFSYASKVDPEKIYTFYEWPCQAEAGTRPYCKTQTSLRYLHGNNGTFDLQDWGWSAQVNYSEYLQAKNYENTQLSPSNSRLVKAPGQGQVFLTKFKLFLGPVQSEFGPQFKTEMLPEGLSGEKVTSDYLRKLSNFIMAELRNRFGDAVEKKDVKWCLTVPSIWTDAAKQIMLDCAEMAGLARGRLCPLGEDASLHKIDIVLEPEAASIYCLQKLKDIPFRKGNKFLVVDAGGGTVDLVVHEKLEDSGVRVKEVTLSTGGFCGGVFVDEAFMKYLAQKIDCFQKFSVQYPVCMLNIKGYWERLKCGFDGERERYTLDLPAKLATAWEANQKRNGRWTAHSQYDEIVITREDMKSIFDGQVNKILKLIECQLEQVPDMEAIMVMGGFANSKYLMKRIRREFSLRVKRIVSPPDPGSAVCQGAVAWGALGNDIMKSRKSRKTYGIETIRNFHQGDPPDSVFDGENGEKLCKDTFCAFTRISEDVPVDHPVTYSFGPFKTGEEFMKFTLYSTTDPNPQYVTDPGVVKVASGTYNLPPEARRMKNELPSVAITMYFGRTHIELLAKPKNFNGGKTSIPSFEGASNWPKTIQSWESVGGPISNKGHLDFSIGFPSFPSLLLHFSCNWYSFILIMACSAQQFASVLHFLTKLIFGPI